MKLRDMRRGVFPVEFDKDDSRCEMTMFLGVASIFYLRVVWGLCLRDELED